MHFIDLLQQGVLKQEEAITYARQNFQHLAEQHEKGIVFNLFFILINITNYNKTSAENLL